MILFNLKRTIRIADTLNQLDVYTSYNVRSYLPILYTIIYTARTRVPYGEEKEMFVYPMTLVFIQCMVNALFAKAGMF